MVIPDQAPEPMAVRPDVLRADGQTVTLTLRKRLPDGAAVLATAAAAGGGLLLAHPVVVPGTAWLAVPVAVLAVARPRLAVPVALAVACLLGALRGIDPQAGLATATVLGALAWSVSRQVAAVREKDRLLVASLQQESEHARQAYEERDALSRRLTHQAAHDALTGLPNRTLFLERLHEALRRADVDTQVGVLFLDLDEFKTVNDSLGHGIGDELLLGVGHRLENALRAGDVVARFGGDEFAVLLLGGGSQEQLVGVANRLLGVLRAPFALTAGMAGGQASGGLVLEARDPHRSVQEQGDDLMRQADLAMYAAKAAGGGRCVQFQDEMQAAIRERLALQDEITHALIAEQAPTAPSCRPAR